MIIHAFSPQFIIHTSVKSSPNPLPPNLMAFKTHELSTVSSTAHTCLDMWLFTRALETFE